MLAGPSPRVLEWPRDRGPTPIAEDAAAAGGVSKGGILVVEDQDAVRQLLVEILRAGGFAVHEADRGDRALAAAEAAGGDALRAVLLDLGLPGKHGLEVAVEIRARWPSLPVILMSGSEDPFGEGGAPGPGFHLLPKPFSPHELIRRLEALPRA
jgi:DNA-binding response OmpR family regulator